MFQLIVMKVVCDFIDTKEVFGEEAIDTCQQYREDW